MGLVFKSKKSICRKFAQIDADFKKIFTTLTYPHFIDIVFKKEALGEG
jgi:hypothetical protein